MSGQPPATRRLLHGYKDKKARFNAYLDDYACLINGLVTLYESEFQPRWISAALELAEVIVDQFWDETGGSFFYTGKDHEQLIARVRDAHDSATPSGNSMAVTSLLRLGKLAGRSDLVAKAERTLKSFAGVMAEASYQSGQMLAALDFLLDRPIEIVLIPANSPAGQEEAAAALRLVRARFLPNKVVASLPLPMQAADRVLPAPDCDPTTHDSPLTPPAEQIVPLLSDKTAVNGKVTVYICENFTCQAPVSGLDELAEALDQR